VGWLGRSWAEWSRGPKAIHIGSEVLPFSLSSQAGEPLTDRAEPRHGVADPGPIQGPSPRRHPLPRRRRRRAASRRSPGSLLRPPLPHLLKSPHLPRQGSFVSSPRPCMWLLSYRWEWGGSDVILPREMTWPRCVRTWSDHLPCAIDVLVRGGLLFPSLLECTWVQN
jgi:hypothetical protein